MFDVGDRVRYKDYPDSATGTVRRLVVSKRTGKLVTVSVELDDGRWVYRDPSELVKVEQ